MTPTELERIAFELIGAKARTEPVSVPWAVQELINSRGEIVGDGTDFFLLCAREHCNRVVKKVVELFNMQTEEHDERAEQMTLDGFEHLRIAYSVERDGERTLVPINQCTAAELLHRAAEFRRQSKGLEAHAREIERYVASRDVTAAAGG